MSIARVFAETAKRSLLRIMPPSRLVEEISLSRFMGSRVPHRRGRRSRMSIESLESRALLAGVYESTVLADSPTAYWRLGEANSATTVADISGNGLSGTRVGGTFGQSGALADDLNTSLHLHSNNQGVQVPDNDKLTPGASSTYEAWIKPAALGTLHKILSKPFDSSGQNFEYEFQVMPDGKLWFQRNSQSGPVFSSTPVSSGVWQHVAVTVSSNSVNFYINGVLCGNGVLSSAAVANTSFPVQIGTILGNPSHQFRGQIDEVAFYQTALSPSRLVAHYQAGTNFIPTNISLSSQSVAENQPAGTAVGNLSTTDTSGNTHSYALVSGSGDTDNSSFEIVGNQLRTKAPFDFETKPSYTVRVRTTDQGQLSFEKTFTISVTDTEEIPPTVTTASFVASGTSAANSTSLSVTFSEPVLGANFSANYELRRAGADGLLGTADDPIANVTSVTMGGNNATLNFAALAEDVYRLTVKDAVTDATGNLLDGDGNGSAGGSWSKDFVAGALITSLASPSGFLFDPEFGGFGAGQFVQGTGNAFDGFGRMSVGGGSFIPPVLSTPSVTVTQVTGTADVQDVTSGWQTISGLTLSYTGDGDPIRLQSSITARALSSGVPGTLQFRFAINGIGRSPVGMAVFPQGADLHIPLNLEEFVTGLAPGTYTISLQAAPAPGFPTSDTYFGWQSGATLRVTEFNSIPASTMRDGGQTVASPTAMHMNVNVGREVTVPVSGLHNFSRTVDTFSNSTAVAVSAPVRIVGNVGSDAATTVFATSDGDLLVEPTDLWFGTDDADGSGTPAIIHLLHGPSGLQPSSVNVLEDNVEWTYELTIPAGETKRLGYFTVLGSTRAEAIASANALVTSNSFGGEAAAFMTTEELSSLVNFQFNSAPTDIALTSNSISESSGVNAVVGTLSFSDPDPGDTATLSLPVGVGSNDLFNIAADGTTLCANAGFDFESLNSYSITVRVTDAGGLSFDKQFTISVTDINEAPTAVNLQDVIATLPENTSTSSRIRVADIVVTDDAIGTNTLSLTSSLPGESYKWEHKLQK